LFTYGTQFSNIIHKLQSCPGVGDDTLHTPISIFDLPEYIASDPPTGNNITSDTPIDFVFVDFVEGDILNILNGMQTGKNYTSGDTMLYSDLLADSVLGVFAQQVWN
jgi:hypothetical protein